MKELKILKILVAVCVSGVVLSFLGGLYQARQDYKIKSAPAPYTIPAPAMGN